MLNFVNLSGKKEAKVYDSAEVLITSTKGDIRLTPLVQALLDVKDGDYLATVSPTDANGNVIAGQVYIAKGKTATPVLDAAGNVVKGANNHPLVVEGSGYGSVLRISSEGSPLLRTSAAVAWANVGGDVEKVKRFTLSEGAEGQVPTGNKNADGSDEIFTGTFYQLIFASEDKKQARKVKKAVATTDAPVEGAEAAEATESTETAVEEVEEIEDDFNEEDFETEVE